MRLRIYETNRSLWFGLTLLILPLTCYFVLQYARLFMNDLSKPVVLVGWVFYSACASLVEAWLF